MARKILKIIMISDKKEQLIESNKAYTGLENYDNLCLTPL